MAHPLLHKLRTAGLPLAVGLSLLSLAACGPLISFGDEGPADQVFGLEYPDARPADGDIGTIVYVEEPLMSDGLSGTQISVVLDDNQRTSLMGVRWSANSTDLVRDYLVRGVGSASGVRMLGEGALDVKAGCRMGVKVWAFEYVPGDSAREDRVHVEIEFVLVRYNDNRLLGQPTFSVQPDVTSAEGRGVVAGFDEAMASISREAGEWLSTQASACAL